MVPAFEFCVAAKQIALTSLIEELSEAADSGLASDEQLHATWIAHNVRLAVFSDANVTWLCADRAWKPISRAP